MLTLLELDISLQLSFSEWLLLKRRKFALTQDDIADALGVSGQTVSNWERGRSIPTLTIDQVKTLCQILQCSLDEIPGESNTTELN
jgi:DNA-binding XRE family transcriptional regulator